MLIYPGDLMYDVIGYELERAEKDYSEESRFDSTTPHVLPRIRPSQRSYKPALFVVLILGLTFVIVRRASQLEGSEKGDWIMSR